MPGDPFDRTLGRHALVPIGQPHRHRQRARRNPRFFDDAQPAHFQFARQFRGRATPQAIALEPDVAAVVGDQPRVAALDDLGVPREGGQLLGQFRRGAPLGSW